MNNFVVLTRFGEIEATVSGEGPALVLLHGIQSTMKVWEPVAEKLSGIKVVSFNMPGRAGSARWTEASGAIEHYYSIESFAEILDSVIRHIGGVVSVAGWSAGSLTVLRYLKAFGGSRINRVYLCSGMVHVRNVGKTFKSETIEELEIEISRRAQVSGLTATADPLAIAHVWKSLQNQDFRSSLADVMNPTTVIHGTADPECPFEQALLAARLIPAAELVPLDGLDHFILGKASASVAQAFQRIVS
ncbi:MAG: alpha/beta hydrolase [Afipia sp.]|nr:alpha/beta hydrolase [Afipia sp.]